MDDQRETKTLPDVLPPHVTEADLISAMRMAGTEREWNLSLDQATFTVGAGSSCDIVIDAPHVSRLHCTLQRRGQRIRVIDQESRNGTYFGGRRERSFDIGPGDVFTVADVMCLAMNREMREVRDVLLELVDFRASMKVLAACDSLLATSVSGAHMLLLGEAGCDQERLARAIHQASPRRYSSFLTLDAVPRLSQDQRDLLDRVRNGTLLWLVRPDTSQPDEAFRSMLLSADFRVRLIAVAPTLAVAVNGIGLDVVARMPQVLLSPLRDRLVKLPALLDRYLSELGSTTRFGDLTPTNQRALLDHNWPRNVQELREVAQRLAALATHRSLNRAAAALNTPRSTLTYWASRLGLALPLDGKGALPESGPQAVPELLD